MKTQLLPSLLLGLILTGCSVEPINKEISEDQITDVNSEFEDVGCAGPDNSKTISLSEAAAIESWDEVRKLYLSLLSTGVARNGTFDPTIWNLIDDFQVRGVGEYTTTYFLSGECSDSVILTINVVEDAVSDPTCDGVSAGEDASKELQLTEAASIESWDEVRKLYLSLLDPGVSRNGTFDPSIWDLINAFNAGEEQIGDYTTTYTITEGDCSDSVQLTITVVPDRADPPVCDLDAGVDNIKTMTRSEAAALPSWDEVRKLYLSLLEPGVPKDGSFDPSIWDLINRFNEPGDNLGDYTTTYTISDGDCTDAVQLTIRILAD